MPFNPLKTLHLWFVAIPALALGACSASETPAPNASSPSPQATSQSMSTPSTTPVAAKAVDPMARGAKLFKRCQSCHSLEEGGRHKVGPNLWAVYGSVPGSKPDFKYSKAMVALQTPWDEETLSAYLAKPRAYLPGGSMAYAGLRKAEDRDALLAFIKAKTSP